MRQTLESNAKYAKHINDSVLLRQPLFGYCLHACMCAHWKYAIEKLNWN